MSKKELAAIKELGSQVSDVQKLIGEITDLVGKVADVSLSIQRTQRNHAARLDAIEKKMANGDILQKTEQGPEARPTVTEASYSKAGGTDDAPTVCDKMDDDKGLSS